MTNKYNLIPSWERDIIEEGKKVIKHGWGKVTMTVTMDGEKKTIDTLFIRKITKDINPGGTDPA